MSKTPYSALMTVYRKVVPQHFVESTQCVLTQTLPTDNFVIVCDGPLTSELEKVIERLQHGHPGVVDVFRLSENVGTAVATQKGVERCKHNLVMKLDADDHCIPERAEIQVSIFDSDPELSICGSYMGEFVDGSNEPSQVRTVPLEQDDILVYSRRRNPFNNITIMYKRDDVIAAGGYGTLRRAQDYELYVRMLHKGYKARNIETVLSSARLDADNLARRATLNNLKGFLLVRWTIFRNGYSSLPDFIIPCAGQLAYMVLPRGLRGRLYQKLLRKSS